MKILDWNKWKKAYGSKISQRTPGNALKSLGYSSLTAPRDESMTVRQQAVSLVDLIPCSILVYKTLYRERNDLGPDILKVYYR